MNDDDEIKLVLKNGEDFKVLVYSHDRVFCTVHFTTVSFDRKKKLCRLILRDPDGIPNEVLDLENPYDRLKSVYPRQVKYLKACQRKALFALLKGYLNLEDHAFVDLSRHIHKFHSTIQLLLKDLVSPVKTS